MTPLLMASIAVQAAAPPPPDAQTKLQDAFDSLTAMGTALGLSVATFFLLWGGYKYMMARGNPLQMERAKQSLEHAAVGFGIVLLANVLASLVKSTLHV